MGKVKERIQLNIAIMGAGLSGLACAITLEQHGVTPTVLEKRGRVGDRFVNGEVLLSLLSRPIHDNIQYVSEQFHIYLQPLASVQQMTIYSQNKTAVIEGFLGFTNLRGRVQGGFEAQLSRQLKTTIQFNSEQSYEQLLSDYTHVIMATGDANYSKQVKNFRRDCTVSMKGATVEGSFDKNSVKVWFDYDVAPKGYGYLIPLSEREANIVIGCPDGASGVTYNMEQLWERFITKVQQTYDSPLRVTDQFQFTEYPIGICQEARIGNTFFVGNCFGSIMPFLGFGQFASILTGVYAAYDLLGMGKYEDLTKPLRQSYENSLVLRTSMEQLTNHHLDRIISLLNGYWGDKLFHSRNMDLLKIASYLLRPYVKLKQGITT
jgi:flavin-dependent dehydrogenase